MKLKRCSRTERVRSPWIEVYQDEAENEDGRRLPAYYVLHYPQPSVCVVIENTAGQLLLIESWRYPLQKLGWEIPAGYVENGELPETAAVREVSEETGVKVETLRPLCHFYPSDGMSDQEIFAFAVRLEQPSLTLDLTEVERAGWFDRKAVLTMLESGAIHCGISMLALRTYMMECL